MFQLLTLVTLVTILVPGFIFQKTYEKFRYTRRSTDQSDQFLRFLTTGLLMLALTWPILIALRVDPLQPLMSTDDVGQALQGMRKHLLVWAVQLMVVPFMFGLFMASVSVRSMKNRVLGFVGLPPLRQENDSAFDAAFDLHLNCDSLVRILYKDDTSIEGVWSSNSAACSNLSQRYIFLEQVMQVDEITGSSYLLEGCSGILIPITDDVKWITFSSLEDEELGDDQEGTHA